MFDTWIIIVLGGLFALVLGRSAVIVFWPDSDVAKFCEFHLGFMDTVGGGEGDCGDGDSGSFRGLPTGCLFRLAAQFAHQLQLGLEIHVMRQLDMLQKACGLDVVAM